MTSFHDRRTGRTVEVGEYRPMLAAGVLQGPHGYGSSGPGGDYEPGWGHESYHPDVYAASGMDEGLPDHQHFGDASRTFVPAKGYAGRLGKPGSDFLN